MWVIITIAAATFQILRTARQHELRAQLSTAAAGFVRYAYGAPLAVGISLVLFVGLGREMPTIPASFWPWIGIAGVSQIAGTLALLASFKRRDFAVGTVYSKSEVLIVAAMSLFLGDDALRGPGWIGALLVTLGVAWLASGGSVRALLQQSGDVAALLGVVAGAGFAGAAVGIGEAAGVLGAAPAFDRAVLTLTALLLFQTVANALWFLVTDPSELSATARAWRPALWVGVLSLLGSIAWAWGFTLESAAKVRTLGQIELIIAFVVARVSLGERHTRSEYAAAILVLMGMLVVTLAG